MSENGFFKVTDKKADEVGGYAISPNWWSRGYEYPWAFQFAKAGMVVADMGCGWSPRPFKSALADKCELTYAVDGNVRILDFQNREGLVYTVADFTESVDAINEESLDRVFCISVLEDVGPKVGKALYQFCKLLKPGGMAVITFDVQYDMDKPLGHYPAVKSENFARDVELSGLILREPLEMDKSGAVHNLDFNLACYHCILEKTE